MRLAPQCSPALSRQLADRRLVPAVIGAGCIGLTTAVELLRRGFPVLVLAHRLPGDPLSPDFASTAAGAHHLSFAASDDWRQRYLDIKTFDVLWRESEDRDEGLEKGVMRLTQTELCVLFLSLLVFTTTRLMLVRRWRRYKGDLHLRLLEELPDVRPTAAASSLSRRAS